MRRNKLNLEFGARVKNFVAPPSGPVAVLSNGQKFDYTRFATDGSNIPSLMAKAFQLIQSEGVNDPSRKKTNITINSGITSFLRWIQDSNKKSKELTSKLLLDYQSHLKTTYKAWTVYGHYMKVARICSVLMDAKLIGRFPIPKNISFESAKAGSSSGSTIATAIKGGVSGLCADDINEKTLGVIVDAAWDEAFEILDCIELGNKWRNESLPSLVQQNKERKKGITKKYLVPGLNPSREECLRLIIQNTELAFGGFSSDYSFTNSYLDFGDPELTELISELKKRARRLGFRITGHELHSYFEPNKDLAGCILFLLSAAQINPESAGALRLDSVQDDSNPDIARVSWFKWRAGGEQTSLPFPKGKNRTSKTIPNLLNRYKEVSKEIRSRAPDSIRDILLIWGQGGAGKKSVPCMTDGGFRVWHGVKSTLAARLVKKEGIDQEVKDITLHCLPQLTLSLVRTTALNVAGKRLNRDISALAAMDGRKSESPITGHYLNNDSTRESWDGQIRQAQTAMLDWSSKKPIILPANEKIVKSQLGVDTQMANDIIEDEFNAGMGASLLDGRIIIIDTPINALRMMQWLAKLEQAQSQIVRDNPERWLSVYQPQHKLFTDALAMLSKKSKGTALKMNKDIQLPFPEVI